MLSIASTTWLIQEPFWDEQIDCSFCSLKSKKERPRKLCSSGFLGVLGFHDAGAGVRLTGSCTPKDVG